MQLVTKSLVEVIPAIRSAPPLPVRNHINILLPSLMLGGAERIVYDLLRSIQSVDQRYTATLLLLHRQTPSYVLPSNPQIQIVYLDQICKSSQRIDKLKTIAAEVLNSPNSKLYTHLIRIADLRELWNLGVQTIPVLHNSKPGWQDPPDHYNHSNVPFVIACCESVAQQAQAANLQKPIKVIRHEIDAPYKSESISLWRDRLRARYDVSPDTFFIGMIGSLKSQKNYARALEIVDQVSQTYPVKLLIAGGWNHPKWQQEKTALDTQIQAKNLQTKVIFAGNVTPVEPLYAAFDLLLNTSDFEGLSISCLEAQAYGCPVLASDVGGQAEALTLNNLVQPANNIGAYITKIESVIQSRPWQRPKPLAPSNRIIPALWWLLGNRSIFPIAEHRTKTPKTLFVINNLHLAGAQRSLTNLLSHPDFTHRCEVCVLDESLSDTHAQRLRTAGVSIWQLEETLSLTQRVEQFIELIQSTQATQICFWNVAPKFKLLASKILADSSIRVFDVSAGSMYFEELASAHEFQQRISWTQKDHFASLQRLIVKYTGGKPPNCSPVITEMIPNGVSCSQFEKHFPSPLPPCVDPAFAIGTCSRITPVKRIDWLIDMMQILGEWLPEASLTIVGGVHPKEQDYWIQLQEKLKTMKRRNVYLVGATADVRPYLQHFQVFTLIAEPGGCPNASLEAMASGVPVVATRFGGAFDQIQPGVNGFLVDRDNPHEMAVIIHKIFRNPCVRANLGRNAQAIASREFSMEQMVKRYLDVLSVL
ncbi:glycosyltransferase family 4 protein [Leptolyngbya sp. AN03gr2]|uniref:glycosyltransferase family 4 protein n=1 Tax=unclassified Leptolyngbya TaxID=2650499 RepID=UPI003D3191A6